MKRLSVFVAILVFPLITYAGGNTDSGGGVGPRPEVSMPGLDPIFNDDLVDVPLVGGPLGELDRKRGFGSRDLESLMMDSLPGEGVAIESAVRYSGVLPSGALEFEVGQVAGGQVLAVEAVRAHKNQFSSADAKLIKALAKSRASKKWIIIKAQPK